MAKNRRRHKNSRRTIKENLELGDLRAEVMHAAQQPYFRFGNDFHRGDTFSKKEVKKFWREEASRMGQGTHYIINNKCLDVIVPSLKKASVRKFVNAFWQARAPHRNFFIEFDIQYLFRQLIGSYEKNPDDKYLQNMLGSLPSAARAATILEEVESCQMLAGVSLKHRRNPSCIFTEGSEAVYKNAATPKWGKAIMPSVDELTFFTAQRLKEGYDGSPLWKNVPNTSRGTMVYSSPVCLQLTAPEDFEAKMASQFAQEHLRSWEKTGVEQHPFNGHTFFEELFQIESAKDYDGLWDAAKLCSFVTHVTHNVEDVQAAIDFRSPTKHFLGFESLVIQVYFAAVSLLNYDWAVNEETGEIARGTKSVNTESLAQDRHIKVTINLPKDKAIKLFHKQRPRTRKFGTAEHLVRGHWRLYKKSGERVWVKEHRRGDDKYGTVHKDYVLTKRDGYLKPKIQKQ